MIIRCLFWMAENKQNESDDAFNWRLDINLDVVMARPTVPPIES